MYIINKKTYEKLSKKLDDDFKALTEKGDYHCALKERINLEKEKDKPDPEYMKKMFEDLSFIKSDIFKLSISTENLRELLHNIEKINDEKSSIIFVLIHPEKQGQEQYQNLQEVYKDFIPNQDEIIIIANTYYCVTKRVFDIDSNKVLIYLSKTRR